MCHLRLVCHDLNRLSGIAHLDRKTELNVSRTLTRVPNFVLLNVARLEHYYIPTYTHTLSSVKPTNFKAVKAIQLLVKVTYYYVLGIVWHLCPIVTITEVNINGCNICTYLYLYLCVCVANSCVLYGQYFMNWFVFLLVRYDHWDFRFDKLWFGNILYSVYYNLPIYIHWITRTHTHLINWINQSISRLQSS